MGLMTGLLLTGRFKSYRGSQPGRRGSSAGAGLAVVGQCTGCDPNELKKNGPGRPMPAGCVVSGAASQVRRRGHAQAHGEWDGVCDLEFGRDGMPLYIEGPHDDTWRIMHTLRQNVGDGKFHYVVGMQT